MSCHGLGLSQLLLQQRASAAASARIGAETRAAGTGVIIAGRVLRRPARQRVIVILIVAVPILLRVAALERVLQHLVQLLQVGVFDIEDRDHHSALVIGINLLDNVSDLFHQFLRGLHYN